MPHSLPFTLSPYRAMPLDGGFDRLLETGVFASALAAVLYPAWRLRLLHRPARGLPAVALAGGLASLAAAAAGTAVRAWAEVPYDLGIDEIVALFTALMPGWLAWSVAIVWIWALVTARPTDSRGRLARAVAVAAVVIAFVAEAGDGFVDDLLRPTEKTPRIVRGRVRWGYGTRLLGAWWPVVPSELRDRLGDILPSVANCSLAAGLAATVAVVSWGIRRRATAGGGGASAFEADCPRCRRRQSWAEGSSACIGCGLTVTAEFDEPGCVTCGYPLRGLTRPVCPECGSVVPPDEVGHGPPPVPAPSPTALPALRRTAAGLVADAGLAALVMAVALLTVSVIPDWESREQELRDSAAALAVAGMAWVFGAEPLRRRPGSDWAAVAILPAVIGLGLRPYMVHTTRDRSILLSHATAYAVIAASLAPVAVGMLSLLRFTAARPRRLKLAAMALVPLSAVLLVAQEFECAFAGNGDRRLSPLYIPTVTAVITALLLAAGLGAMHAAGLGRSVGGDGPTLNLRCPRCGHGHSAGAGVSRCPGCRLRVGVWLEPPLRNRPARDGHPV
jgi:hypothetical protein